MKQSVDGEYWFKGLGMWWILGVLCALPSFVWAWLIGFQDVGQIVAMLGVVGLFVLGFSRLESSLCETGRGETARALKAATWSKIGLSILNIGLGIPDMWLGTFSISAAAFTSGHSQDLAPFILNASVDRTMVITAMQGVGISLLILLITVAILGCSWLVARLRRSASVV